MPFLTTGLTLEPYRFTAAVGAIVIGIILAFIGATIVVHLILAFIVWTRRPKTRVWMSKKTWGLLTLFFGLPIALFFGGHTMSKRANDHRSATAVDIHWTLSTSIKTASQLTSICIVRNAVNAEHKACLMGVDNL